MCKNEVMKGECLLKHEHTHAHTRTHTDRHTYLRTHAHKHTPQMHSISASKKNPQAMEKTSEEMIAMLLLADKISSLISFAFFPSEVQAQWNEKISNICRK